VALGVCPAAIGSQTGGSITRPATYCGVAGLKPTIGRVSVDGVVPVSFHLDHPGPMARHVADLALVFQAIAGPDLRDSLCSQLAVADYLAPLANPQPPRLGLIEPFFLELCDASVRVAVLATVDRLRSAGAEVVSVDLPESFGDVLAMHRRIMAVEAAEVHYHEYPSQCDAFGPHVTALIEEGLATSTRDYTQALRHRHLFQSQLRPRFSEIDALLTPATLTAAPARLDTTGDPRFNSPWSFAGVPTVSLPVGLDEQGMPLGVQLIGGAFDEARLLATAAWCEGGIGFANRPSLLLETGPT
jgi:Asp-tRNA(Asn)/Glu-tRNA(Gln) amidotransferase A subunit family amidase